jgi:hypothetical protein
LNLVLRLHLRQVHFRAYLTAGIGILSVAMPFLATIAGLLVGKEQADTVRTLEQKDGGPEKQRDESLANHKPNLPDLPAHRATLAVFYASTILDSNVSCRVRLGSGQL